MELYSSVWHIISAFLVFVGGGVAAVLLGSRLAAGVRRSLALYGWHTVMCLVYCWYVLTFGGDALGYFARAQEGMIQFEFGTAGVDFLTALLVQGLDLSLLGTFLFFNIFGVIGLLIFDASLRIATHDKIKRYRRLATLIVFLPSISFWSSGIGKDALSFMAVNLALWAALNLGRRAILMAVAIAVMLLVRPHIAGIMVMAISLASVLDSRARLRKKLLFGAVATSIALIMVPFALKYSGLGESVDANSLSAYVEGRQAHNMEGGGGIDIANMSLPMQLFTYLFRPVIFEARSIFAIAAGIDNLILLYLFFSGGRMIWRKSRSGLGENRAFMWSYSLVAWLVLATTTANMGISLRQKWMLAPMLIFLLISVTKRRHSILNKPRIYRPSAAAYREKPQIG